MKHSIKFIVHFLVPVSLVFAGFVQAGNVDKINDYLVKNCEKLDFKSNLETAKQYLNSVSGKSSLFGHSLAEDLKTFISLGRVESGEVQCNAESRAILEANNKLAGDLVKRVQKKGANFMSRYNGLVWSVIHKHARKCGDENETKYTDLKKPHAKDTMAKIRTATGELVHTSWFVW